MVSEKTRRDLIRLAALWVVFSIIAEIGTAYLIGRYPGSDSMQGVVTSDAVFFLLWITVPVFVLVVLIVVYSMIRFRVPDNDVQPSDSQYRSGRAFPWGWFAASAVLNVLFVIHPGVTGLTSLWSMAAAADPLEVDVTAMQWEWSFNYPQQKLTGQRELVVPVNTPVRFVLRSNDVIHSFWVPAWGIKKAVVPGQEESLVVTPNRVLDTMANPRVRLQCSQICGAGHAEMRAVVRVVSKDDFDSWTKMARAGGMDMHDMDMPGMQHDQPMPGMQHDKSMPGMQQDMHMPGMETAPEGGSQDGHRAPMNMTPGQGASMDDGHQMPMEARPEAGSATEQHQTPEQRQMPMETPHNGGTSSDQHQMPMDHNMPMGGQN